MNLSNRQISFALAASQVGNFMQREKIESIVINYSGGGDSGGVEDICLDEALLALPGVYIPYQSQYFLKNCTLKKLLFTVANNVMPDDFENNEGGQGVITIQADGEIHIEHEDNIETYEDDIVTQGFDDLTDLDELAPVLQQLEAHLNQPDDPRLVEIRFYDDHIAEITNGANASVTLDEPLDDALWALIAALANKNEADLSETGTNCCKIDLDARTIQTTYSFRSENVDAESYTESFDTDAAKMLSSHYWEATALSGEIFPKTCALLAGNNAFQISIADNQVVFSLHGKPVFQGEVENATLIPSSEGFESLVVGGTELAYLVTFNEAGLLICAIERNETNTWSQPDLPKSLIHSISYDDLGFAEEDKISMVLDYLGHLQSNFYINEAAGAIALCDIPTDRLREGVTHPAIIAAIDARQLNESSPQEPECAVAQTRIGRRRL